MDFQIYYKGKTDKYLADLAKEESKVEKFIFDLRSRVKFRYNNR